MRFTYYISNGTSEVQVYPLNAGTEKYTYELKDNDTLKTVNMTGSLVISYADFNAQGYDYCQQLTLRVKEQCNGINTVYFEGYFSISEGTQDDVRCTFTITPRSRDQSEIFSDIEINFLSQPTRITIDTSDRSYTNCVPFGVFLSFVAKQANPNINDVISDFFQINPVNVGYTLPGETNYYTNMAVASLSDIMEPVPVNPATVELISFADLMEDLYTLFYVDWDIDENNNLRVEHVTFFKNTLTYDLREPKYKKYLAGKERFTYDVKSSLKFESWNHFNSKQYANLNYDTYGVVNKTENTKKYQTKKIATDYAVIRYFNGSTTNDGIFLFAADSSDIMYEFIGQNYTLTPRHLALHVLNYDRPETYALFESGITYFSGVLATVNNGGYNAKTKIPTKTQADIAVPICCGDNFTFDSDILTNTGRAVIDKGVFEPKGSIVTLTLKYYNDSCGSFLPTDLSGLDLWLKAGTGITYNGSFQVSQWNDLSGHSRHAVQATAIRKPIYDPATKEVIFTASAPTYTDGTFLKTPAFQVMPNKRGTIIVLFTTEAGTLFPILTTFNGNILDVYLFFNVNGPNLFDGSTGLPKSNYGPDGLYEYNRTADTKAVVYQNNVAPVDPAFGGSNEITVPNNQIVTNPLSIGFNPILGLQQNGILKVKEVIIYGRTLSLPELQMIRFYLAHSGVYPVFPTPQP